MSEAPRASGPGPALGILELSSIARGIKVADAVVKRAPARLVMSRPVAGGKHLVVFEGPVAEVEESMGAGAELAADELLDRLELPYAHEQLWAVLDEPVRGEGWAEDEESEAVAIVETRTVCAAIEAADAACKAAPVTIRDVRLAVGITGKAFFTFTGALADVEASADAARAAADERLLVLEVIPSPHAEIRGQLVF
jgi:microcompartment protein CcmL/EutN